MNLRPSSRALVGSSIHGRGGLKPFMLLALISMSLPTPSQAQTMTQTLSLRTGWNAIWIEVQPPNNSVSNVFAGLPLAAVWTYVANGTAVEFIRDQNEVPFNESTWLRHLPSSSPEAFLNNLFAVHAGRAYLVKLTAPATLTLTGRPAMITPSWTPNSFNLRGFPVNPARPPAFGPFLAASTAHSGQRVYQLSAGGQWVLANATDSIRSGEAYWIFCHGQSDYQAPLSLSLELGDGLDYDAQLSQLAPQFRNLSASALTVSVAQLGGSPSTPFSYRQFANNQFSWINLPTPYSFPLGARGTTGANRDLILALRRNAFATDTYASVLEITDDVGTRYLVPVNASKLLAARSSRGDNGGLRSASVGSGHNLAGLWVGTADITAVSGPHSAQPLVPQPARSPFPLKLLIHVAGDGQPRLLKEVVQMWQTSVRTNDAQGNGVVSEPGRFVLLTDDSLLPQFQGGVLRGGKPVGRRISTVDYDFAGGSSNYLAMSGGFGTGQVARCILALDATVSTHPFLHRYHPDHDNQDANFQTLPASLPAEQSEVPRLQRDIQLTFSATDPSGTNTLTTLEYGDSILGGTYREVIGGLHKSNLVVTGTFRLTRVNNSPVLNQ